ncbi:MAG: diguanylate cyclase, partial [Chloroflexota bacterium]
MPREQHDGLTGALTRARLNSRLLQEQQRSARNGGGFALLMVDLDYFKSINDAFGHQRGDQLLVEVVQRIKGAVRQSDQVYRYGGDEFIVLFPNTQPEQAHQLAARVFQQLTSRPYPGSPPVSVTASIGVAAYPSDATTIPNLFEVLDQRHYQGKAYGRGRIVSTNLAPVGGSGPAAPDRLIERDPALQETQRFLRRLPEKRLGALHITGEPQVGRTRFLDEVCKIARLQGYAVLSMRGAPALSARRLGSWMDAQHPWEALKDLHSLSLPAALQQIDQYITRKGLAGLLIAVDNLALVDPPSLELLYGLLAAGPAFVIGLAVTHLPGQLEKLTRLDLDLESRAALQPLSPGGVQIWLRHSLHWEAPAAWVAWLHLHSGGLPGRLHFAIEWLVSHELLDRRAPSAFPPGEQAGERLIEAARQARRAAPELEAFFGREQETEQIKRLLAHSRLVTISGPGGMGKSRLARQAATEWAQDSAQPVCWVRLDHSQDRNQALTAIAAGLGLILQPGDELEQLQKHLQRRKLLLVLDGFERLLDCTHLLDQLTQDAPQVRLLVTSLLPLNLPAEQVIRLQGLPAGQAAAGPGAAVELFVHSARRARPTFDPPPAELQHIGRICQALGGSPLGIQLAAAWVSSFNCAQILDQVLGSDSLPSQHDDERLSSVLDNLWQLLAPSEQHTIAALA